MKCCRECKALNSQDALNCLYCGELLRASIPTSFASLSKSSLLAQQTRDAVWKGKAAPRRILLFLLPVLYLTYYYTSKLDWAGKDFCWGLAFGLFIAGLVGEFLSFAKRRRT